MPVTNPFENEYRLLFDTCIINENKYDEIDAIIDKMLGSKGRYEKVGVMLNVPWNFIAIIHCMEGSLSFKKHLHNGDPLSGRTINVPAGRPLVPEPPFDWEASAIDALTLDGFNKYTDWSITGMLYAFEKYNGLGYRKRGISSPYLWSCSNHYTKGKFTGDGVFDTEAISKQIGAAVFLRRMSERQVAIKGEIDLISQIKQLGEKVKYDPDVYSSKAEKLQSLLNMVGLHLRVDGNAGRYTSDAYFTIAGTYLKGDPDHL